ncbi:MAG TPA: ribosome-associated translation inhibitor RaiA [Myxococcota bacterium]|nr:ribosome-associated translation inhibitor RaiA [Myxococcota bacterium]HKK93893.1 ribosome-associated translation inhibitor RaiA [Longimicrobiales bacterium]
MRIQITARHCEIGQDVRERAEELIERVKRFDPGLSSAEVVFTEEGRQYRAEGILHIDGKDHVVAQGDADDLMAALDQMYDRLSKILRRKRSAEKNHHAPSRSQRIAEAT